MQLNLFNSSRVSAAVEVLATQGGIEARGAIFTRAEVVDFILDLAGYTEDQPLYRKRLLEPSFGGRGFPASGCRPTAQLLASLRKRRLLSC